jgi:hypothetical protein
MRRMHRRLPIQKGKRILPIPMIVALLLLIAGAQRNHTPFVSPEVKFADTSPSGLQIMPASCPSEPHFAGECDSVPLPLPTTDPDIILPTTTIVPPPTTTGCSPPPPSTGDGNWYVLAAPTGNAQVNRNGYEFCVNNSGGFNYFLPAKTGTEIGAFLNAVSHLSGVWYH